jgi:MFS transporter, DHA2 family, multidrug resistance protein
MALFTPDVSATAVVRTGIVQGIGLVLVFVPLSTSTFATLPRAFEHRAPPFFNLMRNIGSSVSISVTGFLLVRYSNLMHASRAETSTRSVYPSNTCIPL